MKAEIKEKMFVQGIHSPSNQQTYKTAVVKHQYGGTIEDVHIEGKQVSTNVVLYICKQIPQPSCKP